MISHQFGWNGNRFRRCGAKSLGAPHLGSSAPSGQISVDLHLQPKRCSVALRWLNRVAWAARHLARGIGRLIAAIDPQIHCSLRSAAFRPRRLISVRGPRAEWAASAGSRPTSERQDRAADRLRTRDRRSARRLWRPGQASSAACNEGTASGSDTAVTFNSPRPGQRSAASRAGTSTSLDASSAR